MQAYLAQWFLRTLGSGNLRGSAYSQCLLLMQYVKNSLCGTRPVLGQVQACSVWWFLRTLGSGNPARF